MSGFLCYFCHFCWKLYISPVPPASVVCCHSGRFASVRRHIPPEGLAWSGGLFLSLPWLSSPVPGLIGRALPFVWSTACCLLAFSPFSQLSGGRFRYTSSH